MRRSTVLALLLPLLFSLGCADQKPVLDGPDGRKAFDDLAAYYADGKTKPPYDQALSDLARGGDPAQHAGQYLLGLFEQGLADETNGRAVWKRQTYWGGGSESPSRDFRKELAVKFGDAAQGDAAIPVAVWLINEEKLPEGGTAGIGALRRIKSSAANSVLADIISRPHPNEEVLTGAIEEVGARRLSALKPQVVALENSYRSTVRAAAAKTAGLLGDEQVRVFQPESAFTPALGALLQTIADRVYTPIPADAPWMDITYTNPRAGPGSKPFEESGWLLRTEGDNDIILDWQGLEISLPKKSTQMTPGSLAKTAAKLEKIRQDNSREALETLSPEGGLTAQFEPGFITMPEALVAAWSFTRGDKATAAAVIFPCFDQAKDDRWIDWATRDLLGNRYHQKMLDKFSLERDYPAALLLAQYLSKPIFDGFNYQDLAKELAAQLPARMDDFKAFTLPTADEWTKQKAAMKRADQLLFLAAHLRLLNCMQMMQPGDVSYTDPQYPQPFSALEGLTAPPKETVINPFNELRSLALTPADIETLRPFATDNTFMPTYSYWRNFHPGRTLHRVSWAIEDLVNDAAQQTLVDIKGLDALDDDGKKQALDKIKAWCAARENLSPADLLAEPIRTTKNQHDFLRAARKAAENKQPQLVVLAVSRAGDFPKATSDLAEIALESGAPGFAAQARQWIAANPPAKAPVLGQSTMDDYSNAQDVDEIRFWSALILVRDDSAGKEGLNVLQPILQKDDGSFFYPHAVPTLLATKNEKLITLACDVLKKPALLNSPWDVADQVRRLFLAGRPECRDLLIAQLKDTAPGDNTESSIGPDGKTITRHPPKSQNVVDMICQWRKDKYQVDESTPMAAQIKQRQELEKWIDDQFALIQQGKAPDMKTELTSLVPRAQVDAP